MEEVWTDGQEGGGGGDGTSDGRNWEKSERFQNGRNFGHNAIANGRTVGQEGGAIREYGWEEEIGEEFGEI